MPEFIFDPVRVERVLSALPSLRAALRDPRSDSFPSAAFRDHVKNPREIYRLLSRPHYRHLRNGLRAIENGLCAGCDFGDLPLTRKFTQFVARMVEVRVADHFLLRSFTVATLSRRGRRVADFRVSKKGLDATIEVYSPRVWGAIADWNDDVRDHIVNLDEPYDFAVSVDTHDRALSPPPWVVARILDETSPVVLRQMSEDLAVGVASLTPFRKNYRHGAHDLETVLELEKVLPSTERPDRILWSGGPTFSGYSPAGVLSQIVAKQVVRKAAKRQTDAATTRLRGLVVDLSRSEVASDLRSPAHRREAEQVLDPLEPRRFGLDFIAFCGPSPTIRRGLFADFVCFDETALSEEEVFEMFRPIGSLD